MPLTRSEVDDFLASPRLAHLATVGRDGLPWVRPVWYVWEDRAFFLTTRLRARKTGRDLLAGAAAAVSIASDADPGRAVLGRGTVEVWERDHERWLERFARRYDAYPEWYEASLAEEDSSRPAPAPHRVRHVGLRQGRLRGYERRAVTPNAAVGTRGAAVQRRHPRTCASHGPRCAHRSSRVRRGALASSGRMSKEEGREAPVVTAFVEAGSQTSGCAVLVRMRPEGSPPPLAQALARVAARAEDAGPRRQRLATEDERHPDGRPRARRVAPGAARDASPGRSSRGARPRPRPSASPAVATPTSAGPDGRACAGSGWRSPGGRSGRSAARSSSASRRRRCGSRSPDRRRPERGSSRISPRGPRPRDI